MNKAESKYYNTAILMNKALIELLNKKDFEFITVKEICEKAGVNRSTFYLHYETVNDSTGKPKMNIIGIDLKGIENIDLSISHCKEYATANVVILYK